MTWYNAATNSVVAWSNSDPDTAVFGTGPATPVSSPGAYNVLLNADITVQDIDLGTASNGDYFNIADQGDGNETLTLAGNLIKTSGTGTSVIQLTNPIMLTAGDHVVAINDTPGAVPELAIETSNSSGTNSITGSGSITLNNAYNNSGYTEYGTLVLNTDNTYTGGTNIVDGALTVNSGGALGSGIATISNMGVLAFGGNGTVAPGTMTITTPITITRNTYTGTNFSDYPDAIISSNDGAHQTVTFNGPFVVDSTDARIAADTSTIVIGSSITAGPDVTAGTAVLDLDGDYAGSVNLTGDNTAYGAAGNAIEIINGVEVNAANDAALGGPGSTLILNGGFIHINSALLASNPAFATNFGGHNINTSSVGTGVDVDQGQTFTANGLSGAGIGMRGGGTLDFEGTNTFTGTPYFDGVDDGPGEGTESDTTATGVVNFEAGSTTTQVGLRVRSATVNVYGTLNVGGAYTSIGADSSGSNGTPDYGTVNITGSGSVVENSGDDFNVSDNANTHGTITLRNNGNLTVGGTLYIGKNSGAVGTINMYDSSTLNSSSLVFVGQNDGTGVFNQYGGSINLTRNGNFTFVVDDGRGGTGAGSGTYNLSGGSLTSAGEIYVGEGVNGNGTWNQTNGTVNFSNWFVVGREGGMGTVNISGGTMTKTGTVGADPGSQFSMGEGGSHVCTMTVSGTGVFTEDAGEFYVGNNSSVGVLNIGTVAGAMTNADATASVTTNNWFAVGRNGTSNGTVNLYDGTLTQATNNYFDISGDGGSATGTVNVYGGTLNAYQMFIGENGSGQATLNINGGNVNLPNNTIFANSGSVTGTLNLNGGTLTAFGFQANNGAIGESGGTGRATFVFNGGTLVASTNNTSAFIGKKVTSIVSTGGAKINTNGFAVAISSALTHDSTLSGADGGLSVTGPGSLTLTGANTYSGSTTVSSAGTLVIAAAGVLPANTNLSINTGSALDAANHGTSPRILLQLDSLTLSGASGAWTGKLDLSNNDMIVHNGNAATLTNQIQQGYNNGPWNGSGGILSSTAAGTNNTALGIELNNNGSGGVLISSFDGQTVTTSDVLVKYTYFGDANLDGVVNGSDYTLIDNGFNNSLTGWHNGDFNYDGVVNGDDYTLIDNAFNTQGASLASVSGQPEEMIASNTAQVAGGTTAVPEPALVGLFALGSLGLLRRRRSR